MIILLRLLRCLTKPERSEMINMALIAVAMLKFLQVMDEMLTCRFKARTANSFQKSSFDSGKALKHQQRANASLYWQLCTRQRKKSVRKTVASLFSLTLSPWLYLRTKPATHGKPRVSTYKPFTVSVVLLWDLLFKQPVI